MSLAPELKKIRAEVSKLLLDPNNPRLFSTEQSKVPIDRVGDPGVQSDTERRLFPSNKKDRFKIDELIQSIRANGYVPEAGGYIFVRKIKTNECYLVLEGNRRLVALRELLASGDDLRKKNPELIESIKSIDVLEIIDEITEEKLQQKISYLLGTCHHGSHKNWSPFARARGIHERYLEVSGQNEETFSYNEGHAESIASLLSIETKEVAERLGIYRVMSQLAKEGEMIEKRNGGIIDRYYSLILGSVKTASKGLRSYIPQDPKTLLLEREGIKRIINLCNFDGTPSRNSPREQGGPLAPPAMINPGQWQYLGKILDDEDAEEREENLRLVEEEHQAPEEVWARRYATLKKMSWSKWLEEVLGVLKSVGMDAEFEEQDAKECITEAKRIVDVLSNK